MRNILTLLRVQIKNAYKLKDEKKSTIVATIFAFIVLGIVFAIMGVGSTLLLGFAFIRQELEREFLTIFFTTSQVIVLIFGTVMMVSTLYYNRDNEFLASMPVTPQQVFFSKFLFVYLNELLLSTAFVFMIGITFGIIAGFSVGFYFLLIPVAILLPFLPLLLSALLSIPIMYVLAFFKNKGIWTTVLLILLFVAVFALYFKFISSVSTSAGGEDSRFGGTRHPARRAHSRARLCAGRSHPRRRRLAQSAHRRRLFCRAVRARLHPVHDRVHQGGQGAVREQQDRGLQDP